MAHPPPAGQVPYANNYSFHGMQNVETTNESMPIIPSEPELAGPVPAGRPPNDYMDTASVASETTMRPPPATRYNDRYHAGGHPQYEHAPHPNYAEPGHGAPYPQSATPYPPQQERPHPGYNAGPMAAAAGGEVDDYESYAGNPPEYPQTESSTRHGRPPPRPPTQYNRSEPSSDANRSESDSEESSGKPNTFLDSLKAGIKNIGLTELLPIASVLGASAYQYYKSRNSKQGGPHEEPQWMRYLNNVAFATNAYGMMKQNPGRPGGRYNQHGQSAFGGFG
ncbi:hypothetical protein LPJ70_006974, partial [Coemansia sp. RSA 2708]